MDKSLDKLIDLAKEVGGDAFPMLVERVWAEAFVMGIVLPIFTAIATTVCIKFVLPKTIASFRTYGDEFPGWDIGGLFAGGACLLLVVASLVEGFRAISTLIAPEGTALLRLLG